MTKMKQALPTSQHPAKRFTCITPFNIQDNLSETGTTITFIFTFR